MTTMAFQSTLPAKEATKRVGAIICDFDPFQSTLPAGEATNSDGFEGYYYIFQSTLPAGEATFGDTADREHLIDFNPRFPRGKRHRRLLGRRFRI